MYHHLVSLNLGPKAKCIAIGFKGFWLRRRNHTSENEVKSRPRTFFEHPCQTINYRRPLGTRVIRPPERSGYLWIELVHERSAVCSERTYTALQAFTTKEVMKDAQEAYLGINGVWTGLEASALLFYRAWNELSSSFCRHYLPLLSALKYIDAARNRLNGGKLL